MTSTSASLPYEDAIPFPKPKPRVSAKGRKDKGRRAEHKVAKMLNSVRTPLSGAAGGGDIISRGLAENYSVEVKARPSFSVQKYLEQALTDIGTGDLRTPLVVLVPDRHRPIVCQYAEDWIAEKENQGPENSYKVRELSRKITKLCKEIEGLSK